MRITLNLDDDIVRLLKTYAPKKITDDGEGGFATGASRPQRAAENAGSFTALSSLIFLKAASLLRLST
jgi:hypothetical protein